MNSNLLNIDEQDIFRRAIEIAFNLNSPLQNPNVQSAYKKLVNSIQNRTPLLTPSTVESPFSKEMLEQMVSDVEDIRKVVGYSDTRGKIISTCNHLLTNANEWPKEMLVGDHESSLKPCNVIYADPMNRFFVTKDEGDSDYYTWKICRPIEQKPKELSEIIKPKQKCYCIEAFSRYNFMDEAIFCEIFDDKVYIRKAGEEESKWITVSHFNSSFTLNPTPEQITAAEEAAINEVKQRFDKMKKEVGNGNN